VRLDWCASSCPGGIGRWQVGHVVGSRVVVVVEDALLFCFACGDGGRGVLSSWVGGADVGRSRAFLFVLFFKTIERYLSAVDPLALYAGAKVSLVAEWDLIFVFFGR